MALVLADRVKETSTTFGTSDMVLLGASSGYQAFNQAMASGDTTYYCIVLQSAGQWEVGIGTYLGVSNSLMRNTVLASSNNNIIVSFSVGTKDVFVTYPAKRSLYGGSSGSLATDVGLNLLTLTNPSAVTFPRFNADNSVSALDATTFRSAIGAGTGSGTVTSVAMTVPTGLSVSGTPITSSGTLALSMTAGYSIPTTSSQTNWDTAYTDRLKWDGGSTGLTASTGRTSLGATTLGSNLFTITNPSAVTFPRFNADNTVSALDAATFRTAIGAGTGTGTVTSVTGTSPVASSGGATPAISLASGYGDTQNPYASKTANYVLAAPNGTAGVPTFRAIVAADIPTLNQNTTGTAAGLSATLAVASGGTGATTAATARTNLGATTVGGNMFTLTNPSAITFPRFNADNTVSALDAATFRTAIGAGTGSGTVTSVTGTSPVASSGGATPAISLSAAYGDTLNPYGSKTANYFLAAPNGTAGTPSFRALVAADVPTLNQNTTGTAAGLSATLAIASGGTGATSANAALNNLQGYTTTATAAGTTTLTSSSSYKQYFTGTTTQTVVMPDVTTLALGRSYEIINNSTGTLTVNSSGANLITTIPAGISGVVTCIAITGTTAASWHYEYASFDSITGTGANVFATSPTLVTPILGTPQSGNFSTGTFTWPTFNQSTTGSAATLTTTRTLWGQNFNGSANVTGAMSGVTTLSMSSQLTNTVATGTAPMVISSTTRVSNLNVATAGTADVATTSTITTSSTSSAFKVPFANTTASTTGNYGLLQDSAAEFTYNPSTNTLTVGTVSGNLSGTASSATTASSANTTSSLAFSGGGAAGTVNTVFSTLPTLTTGMALCISDTATPIKANFEAVVKQLTSTDATVTLTETSPGVWDLSATTPPPAGAGWYTLQSTTLGNLASTIAMPSDWTSTPTGGYGNLYAYASSTNGSGWATGLSGPTWNTAGPTPMWTSNQAYLAQYYNWSSVTDPATVWILAPTQGFVFTYMQYPPQSSNTSSYDVWGSGGSWNNSYGSSYMYPSGSTSGSTRVFYLAMVITGNQTVTVNGSLFGTTLETAYDSWSNYTYVFFKCTDNGSVGNILNGMSYAVSWMSPTGYYGHSWYEYT